MKLQVQELTTKTISIQEKKLQQLTENASLPFSSDEIINNLANHSLTSEEEELLKHGLDYGIPPPFRLRKTNIFYSYELLCKFMCSNLKNSKDSEIVRSELTHFANVYLDYKPSKSSLRKHNVLKRLKQNDTIVITRPDKGNGVVIINKQDYIRSIQDILSDERKFKILSEDPTLYREGQLQRRLLKLKKKDFFSTKKVYEDIYPNGSKPARIYGLPKMHKDFVTIPSFRPIVSSIGTFNYKLASFLGDLVKTVIPSEHSCADTFTFLNELNKNEMEGKFMVSFDVCSLFTNIPLNETIDLAVDLIFEKHKSLKATRGELRELFEFSTSKTNFIFQGVIYDQIDGIAMGSPLAPILANLFMGYNENKWLEQYQGVGPQFYKRYVDDIFATFNNENEAGEFFDYINTRHPNLKFTKEYNQNGVLPFLDVVISNSGSFQTSVYHKCTYTGLLTNFKSYVPFEYKTKLIKTLLDRTYKINSNWKCFDVDVKNLSKCLLRNLYPKRLIDKVIKTFLDKKIGKDSEIEGQKPDIDIRYIKLPYIKESSTFIKGKIKKMLHKYCNTNIDVRIVFDIHKIRSYFSTKDVMPSCFKSSVIYHFECAGCNSCYVGRTHKHFNTRRCEHLNTDKTSAIFKHINGKNSQCKDKCDEGSFKIIDYAKTDYELALKEAMHIKWEKPNLCTQKKHAVIWLNI